MPFFVIIGILSVFLFKSIIKYINRAKCLVDWNDQRSDKAKTKRMETSVVTKIKPGQPGFFMGDLGANG
jgi:hypothetical protein